MKMKGTALAILMSLAMVFAMMPMMAGAAYADSEVVDAGIKYTLHDNGEATVSGHTDALQDSVIIPDNIKSGNVDYAVTSIGVNAFFRTGLTSITIPKSVTSIERNAFCNCSNLGTVVFAEGSKLESIGEDAFRETGIPSITIPESVTIIGGQAFQKSGLTSITIPGSVTNIGDFAFYNCSNLGTVTFAEGSKLESIGGSAFRGTALTSITIPESVTSIGDSAFQGCSKLGTVEFAEGSKLESIGDSTFQGTGLTSITIPENVTSIGGDAFNGTGLTSISIPKSVTSIGKSAFCDCTKLGTVAFAEGSKLESIGEYAFRGTAITSITIPESVTSIGNSAFFQLTNLGTVTFAEGSKLESIGEDAFRETGITSITIPESMKRIGESAFYDCTNLGTAEFAEGSKLENIGISAFEATGITGIILPEGITVLSEYLFCNCNSLKEVSIPSTVGEIQNHAFYKCNNLETIYFDGTMSQWDAITGDGKPEKTPILRVYAPAGKTLSYNGEEQTGVDADIRYTLSGTVSAKAAGSYQATATLNDGNIWSDGTTAPKTIDWKIDKAVAKVTTPAGKTLTYNGQEQAGVEAGEGYTLNGASATDAGTYTATATIKEDPNYVYEWSDGTADPRAIDWTIDKANNPLSIKGRAAVVKSKKLKKKNQKLVVTKVITFTKKGQGKLTYTKASGNKKIAISKTTGKVTVRKGLKKGTYKVKVKVKAAGNSNYNASTWKTATFKIKVK